MEKSGKTEIKSLRVIVAHCYGDKVSHVDMPSITKNFRNCTLIDLKLLERFCFSYPITSLNSSQTKQL